MNFKTVRTGMQCDTWFERDRKHVSLTDAATDRVIFELWDEAVDEAIEDGFLTVPKYPRPTNAAWLPHLVEYAKSQGLIT